MTGTSSTMANLVAALNEANSKEPDSESMISVKDRLKIKLQDWSHVKTGFPLNLENKDMFGVLVLQLGNKDVSVRTQATNFLSACLKNSPDKPPPPAIFDAETLIQLRTSTMNNLFNEISETKDVAILQQWNLLVKLLGIHLHSGSDLINTLMLIVERAFKAVDNDLMKEEAFRSWTHLMDNFSLSQDILNTSKRVNLLTKPLLVRNAKTESTSRIKLETWWHLIILLGDNCKKHFQAVVVKFIEFSYGERLDKPEDDDKTSGALASPYTPMSPVKKHSGLDLFCLDALVQLIASRPLDASLPKPQLKATLQNTVVTPLLMRDFASPILFAVQEATVIVKPVNRSEILRLSAIWAQIGKLFISLSEICQSEDCGKEDMLRTLEAVYWYVKRVKEVVVQCRRQDKLHKLLLSLLDSASRLSHKVLNTTYKSKNDKDPMSSQKPAMHLLQVAIHQDLLPLASQDTQYLEIVQRLINESGKSPSGIAVLTFINARMEEVARSVTGPSLEGLTLVWQAIVEFAVNLDNLEALGGFGPILSSLVFPVKYFSEKGADSKVWKEWSRLYQAAVAAAEVSVTKDTSYICHQLTILLVAVAKAQETKEGIISPGTGLKPTGQLVEQARFAKLSQDGGGVSLPTGQLAAQARCVKVMVEHVDLPSLARLIKSRDPLPNFAPRVSSGGSAEPLGNLTALVNHINSLFNYIDTSSTWSYSRGNSVGSALKSVLSSYQHLLTNVNQQELIRPLLRIVTPTISKMLSDKFLKTMSKHLPNLPEEVEKVFSATALMIQARYSGNYTKEFLFELEDFFIASFGLGKKLIKTKTNEMWQVTFGVLLKDEVPPALASVLKKCGNPNLRAQWSQEEVVSFPSSTENSSQSQPLIVTAEPAIANAINRKVTPKKSPPPQNSTSKPEDVSEMKPPPSKPLVKKGREQPAKKKTLSLLEDESSQDFVPIKSKAPKKRVLTEHQKDVLTSRHDDIPALYSELSRDDSVINLPSQFMSQPSMDESLATTDLWDKIKGGDEPKKVETSDPGGKEEDINGEHLNGGSQSLLEVEKKTLMKELKNKRFELKLEDTPKAEKNAKDETKKLRSKRKRKDDPSEGDEKRTKLDLTDNSDEENGKDKTKEAIADALFKSSQSNPDKTEDIQTDDPDSVEIVIPDPKPAPETVTLQSSDEMTENVVNSVEKNSHIETNGMGLSQQAKKDLPKVNVKVHKLSPVDTKKYMDHDKDVSVPVKKKLFGEVTNDSQDDSSAASSEDDIIQSSQPQAKELEQSRSIRGRRSLAKLDMEVKQMPKKKLTRGKRDAKSDSNNEGEKRNPFGETALHAAAKKGDVSKVEEQLVAGADPNVKDNAGWYPLHEVSISDKENSVAILNLLIQHGASVDCQNKEGVTPLQEAVENAKDNVMFEKKVEVLLSAGANPDLKTVNGKSAFDFAEGNSHLIDLLSKDKKDMNVTTPVRSSGREKKRSVRLANFVDIDRNDDKENAESAQVNDDKEEKIESENSDIAKDSPNENISGDNFNPIKESTEAMEVDETPNTSIKENAVTDESSCTDNGDKVVQTCEKTVEGLKTDSKERCEGSSSPDANKENVLTNRDDDHGNSTKTPFGPLNVLANISGEEKKEKVNPFTAVIEKHKAEIKKRPSLGSAGTSRGAMLLSLSRRSSLDTFTRPSPAALGAVETPASPAPSFSSPKPDLNKAMPWVKYKPSPSSASPSASILKRKGIDADASSNCEDSPVSAKNARLDTSLNGRRVHFNEDPVSDSVEIPRAPDGKHTRKKLQLSGYDQEMFVETKSEAEIEQESQPSQGLYSGSPPIDLGINAIYPDLANSKEPIAVIVPHLATGNWAKILATDLKNNGITQVGQLAIMDPCQIRTLRGVKPNKVDSVKNTLKTFHQKLLKEGKMVEAKKETAKAPVEEVTTPEDEEKIKEDLFLRPSPSPTDLGFSPLDAIPSSPNKNDIDVENFEVKKESPQEPFEELSRISPILSPVKETSPNVSPAKKPILRSPEVSPSLSPSKMTSNSPSKPGSSTGSPELKSEARFGESVRIPRLKTIKDVSEDVSPELENDLFETPEMTDQNSALNGRDSCVCLATDGLDLNDDLLKNMSNEEVLKRMETTKEARVKLTQQLLKISQFEEKLFNKLKSNLQ